MASSSERIPERKQTRAPAIITAAAIALYVATFATMGILQYHAGNVKYVDTGNFEEMLWRALHGQFLRCTLYGHCFLGEHVQFIHLLLLPIYVFYPNLQTLMVAQTVALALGALPLYALASEVLKSRWLGCAFAVAYLLYTPVQMLNLEGGGAYNAFRPETFAVPLLLAAFYFLARGRVVAFSVFAFLTLLCKEELGLTLFMLGLYAAWVHRRRAFGLTWAAVGLVWFLVSLQVIIPLFRGEASHAVGYYPQLGGSAGEVAWNLLAHPVRAFEIAFAPEKLEFLLILFLPVGFLCLLSPVRLAIAAPALGICLLSQRYATYTPWFHYHAPIVPFVFIAGIYGMRNLWRWAPHGQAAGGVLLLACALGTNVAYSKSPLSFRFYDPKSASGYQQLYVVTPHARQIPEVVRLVPRDARVSASLFLNTFFTHHTACYVFPQGFEPGRAEPPDYVALDLKERWLFDDLRQREVFEQIAKSPDFERLPAPEGFLILKRRETR